jgi:hypothetical protein
MATETLTLAGDQLLLLHLWMTTDEYETYSCRLNLEQQSNNKLDIT